MEIKKAYKFRIYPTPEQRDILLSYEGRLRWLWNLANWQRRAALSRCKDNRVFINYNTQAKEMTQMLPEVPWLEEIQCQVRQEVLRDLEKAWQRFFKGVTGPNGRRVGKPRFKRRHNSMRFYLPSNNHWHIENNLLYAKVSSSRKARPFGAMQIMQDCPIEGKTSSCTIVRDVDQWFAVILSTIEIADPIPSTKPRIAIDRGVVNAFADSTGRIVENPSFLKRAKDKLARAQKKQARKQKGSKNWKKDAVRVAKIHRKVRRQREYFLHNESVHYTRNYGEIGLEKLQISNMTKSAKGTPEEPGKMVKQKSGLNRSILDVGWGKFGAILKYKAERNGNRVIEVPAAYSSQTCSACEYTHQDNRPEQSVFLCQKCGHEENADVNAAKVLEYRMNQVVVMNKKSGVKIGIKNRSKKVKVEVDNQVA